MSEAKRALLYWERCDGDRSAMVERARVGGGWLYRGVRQSPCPHVTALTFVPDPAKGTS